MSKPAKPPPKRKQAPSAGLSDGDSDPAADAAEPVRRLLVLAGCKDRDLASAMASRVLFCLHTGLLQTPLLRGTVI